jgi:hypothetical protein
LRASNARAAACAQGLQRNQAPNYQQMSALAVAMVKSSVPRGEYSSSSEFEIASASESTSHGVASPFAVTTHTQKILVGPARRLHHAIQRQAFDHHDLAHVQLLPPATASTLTASHALYERRATGSTQQC